MDTYSDALQNQTKDITMIVLTGGPCAGKSSAVEAIKGYFGARGYTVLCIAESATELIVSGVAPWTTDTVYDYQLAQFKLQLDKEETYLYAAEHMPSEKFLIVCDRGLMDGYAYTTADDMERILEVMRMTPDEACLRYDAVFHMVTAARGTAEFYALDSNMARTETVEEAIELDDRTIRAWSAHPFLRVIENTSDFEDKIQTLLEEIATYLDMKAQA